MTKTMTQEEWEAANKQWLADLKAGKFRKQRPEVSVALEAAQELGVAPPPLPLSPEGQGNAEKVLRGPLREKDTRVSISEDESSELALTSTRRILLAQLAWSQGYTWPLRTGPSDSLTYDATVRTAIAANELTVGMSRYTLAELTGLSPSTAYRSMKRHVAKGWFTSEPPTSEELGTRYTVVQTVLQGDTKHVDPYSSLTAVSGITMQQPPHDAFRGKGGLSKAALRVYQALDLTQAQTAADLARKLKRNRSSAGRMLDRLADFGLAIKTDTGWLKADVDLEEVAASLGTIGATQRMRAYLEGLREGYRAYLKRKGGNAEHSRTHDVRPEQGTVVSTTRETSRADGDTALPSGSPQPLPSTDGPGVPAEPAQGLGRDPARVLPDDGARQFARGVDMGWERPKERAAVCPECGQVQHFSASNLAPYKCAYCKVGFEWVDEAAMVAA